jgi:hypothetical protein
MVVRSFVKRLDEVGATPIFTLDAVFFSFATRILPANDITKAYWIMEEHRTDFAQILLEVVSRMG